MIALYNGGPAGVIYEFITVSCFYFMIAACIAEMASSIPSSAGVYHWASVTGGVKFGKVIGFYAGWYVQWKIPDGGEVNSPQVECVGLDLWHSIHNLNPLDPDHFHVRPIPLRLCL